MNQLASRHITKEKLIPDILTQRQMKGGAVSNSKSLAEIVSFHKIKKYHKT